MKGDTRKSVWCYRSRVAVLRGRCRRGQRIPMQSFSDTAPCWWLFPLVFIWPCIYIRLCLVLCLVFINDNNNSNNPDRALVRISFFPSSPKYFFFFLIFFFCTKPLAVSSSSSSITYTYCWAYHLGLLGSDVYISNVYIYAAGQHANGVGSILLLSRRALHCTAPALYPSNMDIRWWRLKEDTAMEIIQERI